MNATRTIMVLLSVWVCIMCAGVTHTYAATVFVANYGDGSCSLANAQAAYFRRFAW